MSLCSFFKSLDIINYLSVPCKAYNITHCFVEIASEFFLTSPFLRIDCSEIMMNYFRAFASVIVSELYQSQNVYYTEVRSTIFAMGNHGIEIYIP